MFLLVPPRTSDRESTNEYFSDIDKPRVDFIDRFYLRGSKKGKKVHSV